jgi:hypothetical protein
MVLTISLQEKIYTDMLQVHYSGELENERGDRVIKPKVVLVDCSSFQKIDAGHLLEVPWEGNDSR